MGNLPLRKSKSNENSLVMYELPRFQHVTKVFIIKHTMPGREDRWIFVGGCNYF